MLKKLFLLQFFIVFYVFSAGCEQKQNSPPLPKTAVKTFSAPTVLQGTASDGKTPYKTGTVSAVSESGQIIVSTAIDNGHFTLTIPKDTVMPLVLKFTSESIQKELMTVVITESISQYFITPTTTSIAKAAKAMGGYTHTNMVRAAEDTTHAPDANKTTTGWRGDPTTQYGGWH
jgi:hypothetical protein